MMSAHMRIWFRQSCLTTTKSQHVGEEQPGRSAKAIRALSRILVGSLQGLQETGLPGCLGQDRPRGGMCSRFKESPAMFLMIIPFSMGCL